MSAKVTVYNEEGKKVNDLELNPAIFGVQLNPVVVHQVVVAMQANQRQNLAHTKDRGAVRGGGRKPWRQKGTGRARHGSRRSPIWIGGGVTFGPTNDRNFTQKINKKMRRKALFMALSDRVNDSNLKVLESLSVTDFDTQKVVSVLKNLDLEKSVLLVVGVLDAKTIKSVTNIPKVDVIDARNLNVLEVSKYKYAVVTADAIKIIESTFLEDGKDEVDKKEKVSKPVKGDA